MADRLVQTVVPADRAEDVPLSMEDLEEEGVHEVWHERLTDGSVRLQILVRADASQAVLDHLEGRFGDVDGFRAVVLDVAASIPHEETEEDATGGQRIGRDELYADVREMSGLDRDHLVLVALATVVACIGLILDNVAVVIGSMVIAPFLGPNVGLALSATLADRDLAVRALRAAVAGLALSAVLSVSIGVAVPIDPDLPQIAVRSSVTLWDVALGVAVGGAGVMSVTRGVSQALVGVMVAVALLPPLAAFGLLLGSGFTLRALRAVLLLATYLICINLAGVVTFAAQGVRPRTWWEEEEARRSRWRAVVGWSVLLALLVVVILVSRQPERLLP